MRWVVAGIGGCGWRRSEVARRSWPEQLELGGDDEQMKKVMCWLPFPPSSLTSPLKMDLTYIYTHICHITPKIPMFG
jgi:hypothetical protein